MYSETVGDSLSRLGNWILRLLKIEYIKKIEIFPDIDKLYLKHKDLFNALFILAFLVYWILNMEVLTQTTKWFYYLILIVTSYTIIDRILVYLKLNKF
ncbi:hypothetical protein CMO83_03840 [Candidatus Woesearchaeota archaeon]|jgi:hypothetical protein|nr:hypothetical protein [Candidatus Woesearchaeota archaeon]MAG91781.1 hypothetical protein [Candidatus Woesearchaeota archaeon]|tara:strand:+ start:29807 stop:30100 length:294 start_codon:yes stop_codon:yes gene_type:complete